MNKKATFNKLRSAMRSKRQLSEREHDLSDKLFEDTRGLPSREVEKLKQCIDRDWWRMAADECLKRGLITQATAHEWRERIG